MALMEQPRRDNRNGNGVAASHKGAGSLSAEATLLRDAFARAGFKIDLDPEYGRRYKLDFVINRVQYIHAHINLGVKVTSRRDDAAAQEAFLLAARRNVVHKAIYIEVEEETLDTGGMSVAFGACMAFLFDRRQSATRHTGVRIFEDSTFQFFDLEENLRRLQRQQSDLGHRVGQEMTGSIIAYFTDKGFGFIEVEKDQKYFFHIANVLDDDLRLQLPSYHPGEDIPVLFKFGGSDGKKYPKALDITIDHSTYDDDDQYEDFEDVNDDEKEDVF